MLNSNTIELQHDAENVQRTFYFYSCPINNITDPQHVHGLCKC